MENIPDWMAEAFQNYISPEVTTKLGRQPSTYPLLVYYSDDSNKFYFTSSPGLSRKFDHIRKDDRVSILYSKPYGSGTDLEAEILVQGRVVIHDNILENHERIMDKVEWYLSMQPSSKLLVKPGLAGWFYRKFMWWYPYRLIAEFRAVRIIGRQHPDAEEVVIELEELEEDNQEVGSTKSQVSIEGREVDLINQFDGTVLTYIDENGFPYSITTGMTFDGEVFHIDNVPTLANNQRVCLLFQDFDHELDDISYLHVKGHYIKEENIIIPTYTHHLSQSIRVLLGYARNGAQQTKRYFQERDMDPPELDLVMDKAEYREMMERVNQKVDSRNPSSR